MEHLVLKYIEFLKTEMRSSENTINSYISDLKMYICYLKNNNITDFSNTNTDTLNLYIQFLINKNMKESTISRKISSLKSFYGFLKVNEIISENPADVVRNVRVEKQAITVVSNMKADFIINLPDIGEYSGIRDMAILETVCGGGARISEVINLKLSDVDFKAGTLVLRTDRKYRTILMYEGLSNIFEVYIKYSRPRFIKEANEEILFLNKYGRMFSRQGIWKMMRKYIDRIPDGRDITPNKLRQSLLVHLFENVTDDKSIQNFAGYKYSYSLKKYKNAAKYKKRKPISRAESQDLTILNAHPRKAVKHFESIK